MPQLLARAGAAHNGHTLTPDMIRDMVETWPAIGRAPLTFGHVTKQSAPKAGDITAISANEDFSELYGDPEPLEAVKPLITDGFFNERSIGVGKDAGGKHYLHHVALLGAVPPAIKNMPVLQVEGVEFADDQVMTFDFSDSYAFSTLSRAFRTLREWLIDRFSTEDADKALPSWYIDDMEYAARQSSDSEPVFSDNQSVSNMPNPTKPQTPQTPQGQAANPEAPQTEPVRFADDPEYKAMRAQLDQMRADRRKAEVEAVRQAASGRVPANLVDRLAQFADQLGDDVVQFADDRQACPRAELAEMLKQLPKLVEEGQLQFADDTTISAEERMKVYQKF